jgi:hypothetical protein
MKTRNFFLALFGFVFLGLLWVVLVEIIGHYNNEPPHVSSASPVLESTLEIDSNSTTPSWLIPLEIIESGCNHPWIIRIKIPSLNHSLYELIKIGLSDCYQITNDVAIQNHLWHQGISQEILFNPVSKKQILNGSHIELFFNHDADFIALGVDPPETFSISGYTVHDLNADGEHNPNEPIISGVEICLVRDTFDPLCVMSDRNGYYELSGILPGAWWFRILSPTTDKASEF